MNKLIKIFLANKRSFSLLLIYGILCFGVACKSSKQSKNKDVAKVSTKKPRKEKIKETHSPSNEQVEQVIKIAKSYIGTSYRYGGTNRAGLDCSGLVMISYKGIEIQLPRNSEQQSKVGKAISLKDIQAGDLLFFSDKKGHKKISHVGIVTEVKDEKNIKFIHATTKLGVVENNLMSEVYFPIFIKATRVL
ncbi:MAG: NlpC/P60 family protein [Cytophagales bacterium]|nr:MAG: NlpC/P60 family protein [Cytophagales bacterium]